MSCYIQLFPNPIRAKTPTVPRGHLVSCAMVLMEGTTIEGDESLRLTRSSTVFHSLLRVFGSGKIPSHLTLHVVGADHRCSLTINSLQTVLLCTSFFSMLVCNSTLYRSYQVLFSILIAGDLSCLNSGTTGAKYSPAGTWYSVLRILESRHPR